MPTWILLALTGVSFAQDEPAASGEPPAEADRQAAAEEPEADPEGGTEAEVEPEEGTETETEEGTEAEVEPEEGTEAEAETEEDAPSSQLTAELGGTYTVGNAWVVNVAAGVDFKHEWGKNLFGATASTNLNLAKIDADASGALSDEERAAPATWTSQRVRAGLRYDRQVTERGSLFVGAGFEHDFFAGLLWRFNESLGYRRLLVKSERTSLNLEAGLSYNQENLVTGADDDGNPTNDAILDAHYMAARVFFGFRHAFNDAVQIGNDLEMIEPIVGTFDPSVSDGVTNFEDFRLNNSLFLQAKVSDVFSIKLSSTLLFDNQPVPGFVKTDHITAVTLVASIF